MHVRWSNNVDGARAVDAPALARDDVGIAIGAGTDAAVESAGVVAFEAQLPRRLDLRPGDIV